MKIHGRWNKEKELPGQTEEYLKVSIINIYRSLREGITSRKRVYYPKKQGN